MEEVQDLKMVSIRYRMSTVLSDGTVKDHPEEDSEFVFGVTRQAPTLEKFLLGANVGYEGRISIPSSEIYGEHDPELIREIPKKGLIKQRIKVGQYYRQMKMGSLVSFKILEVKPDAVVVDFNKPMAGIGVNMEVKVTGIRDATRIEIETASEEQMKKDIGCG